MRLTFDWTMTPDALPVDGALAAGWEGDPHRPAVQLQPDGAMVYWPTGHTFTFLGASPTWETSWQDPLYIHCRLGTAGASGTCRSAPPLRRRATETAWASRGRRAPSAG